MMMYFKQEWISFLQQRKYNRLRLNLEKMLV